MCVCCCFPAVGDRQPSFDEAVANLGRVVCDNAPADAMAAFEKGDDFASAKRCSTSAAAAMLMNREIASGAALLRAQQLEPANPERVMNLAGIVASIGMPRHALALLQSVEKSGEPFAAAGGLNPRAVLMNNRGNALRDRFNPLTVTLCVRAFRASDVIGQWTEIRHDEEKPVVLARFASAALVAPRAESGDGAAGAAWTTA